MNSFQSGVNIGSGLALPFQDFLGKCMAILGIRGSGKTNTSAVLLEEFLFRRMPVIVVDIDGEYWGLKERFEVVVAGKSSSSDVVIDSDHGAPLARESLRLGIPLILDVSDFMTDDINTLLLEFFDCLWEEAGVRRTPCHVVLEEAHEFVPQSIKTDLKEILVRIALRGRKRGLGLTLVSQRSAKVEKDVLTQAELLFLHKVVHPSDLRVYKDIISWPSAQVDQVVSELGQGDAILVFGNICEKVSVRKRYTFHAGFTPDLMETRVPELKQTSEVFINAIKEATKLQSVSEIKAVSLQKEINRLRLQVAERDKQINQLENQLQIASRLRLDVDEHVLSKIMANVGVVDRQNSQSTTSAVSNSQDSDDAVSEEVYRHADTGEQFFGQFPEPIKLHGTRILKRISKLSRVEKEVLKLLVSRHPSKYTYLQMKNWLIYNESTLYKNNPSTLVRMGLVARTRKKDGYHFWSTLDQFVNDEFRLYVPQIGEVGLEAILNFLRNWICTI